MYTRFLFLLCTIAWADQPGNVTLTPNTFLDLDNGDVSRTAGDIFFTGSAIVPEGGAGLHNLGKVGSRAFKSIKARHAVSVSYAAAPIPAAALVTGDVFGVHTNSGRYAKIIVTATNNGTLSLQYTVFGVVAPRASTGPAITELQNNYSWILPGAGLPNYGIAPGSIFAIVGTGLSSANPPVLQSSAPPGLPTTLNQTSVSVTVNGVTTTPALYYTSATQVAAVLPSTTPVGNGTITLSYNGQSATAPINVIASAPGLDTAYGTGYGSVEATDVNGNVFGFTNSAMPSQTIVLWGSGIGADPANDDRIYPQKSDNLSNIPLQVFIGGVSANILYQGRSVFPGLDQYNVVVPANVTPGCFVSVVAQVGSVVSNAVTLPISANGGPCSDALTGLSGTTIQALANKPSGTANVLAAGVFVAGQGSSLAGALGMSSSIFGQGYEYVSDGSCTIVPPEQGPFNNFLAAQAALDAGTIQLSGPNGQLSLGSGPGIYQVKTTGLPDGAYTLTGSGGKDVGSFQVSVNVPAETLNWTNQAGLASVTRAQGATVTWTGGFPNGWIQVVGSVGAPALKFFCYAPTSAGQFTIPSSILLALPPGSGSIIVQDLLGLQTISASGLDLGLVTGGNNVSGGKAATTFK